MNEPIGRLGSLSPARARRTAFETISIASSWPMTRLWSASSMWSSRSDSSWAIRVTGMPVHIATTWAISSSSTVGWSPDDLGLPLGSERVDRSRAAVASASRSVGGLLVFLVVDRRVLLLGDPVEVLLRLAQARAARTSGAGGRARRPRR